MGRNIIRPYTNKVLLKQTLKIDYYHEFMLNTFNFLWRSIVLILALTLPLRLPFSSTYNFSRSCDVDFSRKVSLGFNSLIFAASDMTSPAKRLYLKKCKCFTNILKLTTHSSTTPFSSTYFFLTLLTEHSLLFFVNDIF